MNVFLDDKVLVQWAPNVKQHYLDRGYAFTKMGDEFFVKLNDLPEKSSKKVRCACDYCGEEFSNHYSVVRNLPHSCKKCRIKKTKQTNLMRYGVESCSQLDSVKKKKRKTFLAHYPTKESRVEMRKRLEDTREKKTGYRSPFHDPNVRSKARETLKGKTGYDNPWKDPSLKHSMQVKIAESLSKNETARTSEQQKHIASIINAKLNQNIDIYVVDMVLCSIVIEYDGGGHFELGRISNSEQEMIEKERKRDQVIISNNYKIIHIISKHDFLPEDDLLKNLINKCINFLDLRDVVYLDIDNQTIRDSDSILFGFKKGV